MNDFRYTRVQDLAEAKRQLLEPGARMIAGGTNLIDLMKEGTVKASHLIDINGLPFRTIESLPGDGVRIGALVTNSQAASHPEIERLFPLLSKAILAGASAQLRNMATMGGNILQRTRCYYFYDAAAPCNKREPGAGCGALKGVNRNHAILGTSVHCIATHPSDMAVALAALEARVNVSGPNGDRVIPFAEFHRLPGDRPELDNTLEPGEVIVSFDLSLNPFAKNYSYVKARERSSYAFALASAAVGVEMRDEKIGDVRFALGGVAHKPWRKIEAEDYLRGREATRENFKAAAALAVGGAQGFGQNNFKIELAQRVLVRALDEATLMREIH